jgi:hypothetical protein
MVAEFSGGCQLALGEISKLGCKFREGKDYGPNVGQVVGKAMMLM